MSEITRLYLKYPAAEKSVSNRRCKFLSNRVMSDNLLCFACQAYANVDIDAVRVQA